MEHLSADEIAHLTQATALESKENCRHEHIADQEGLYICLDCGMESRRLEDFN